MLIAIMWGFGLLGLALVGLAAFFLAKGIALTLDAAAARVFHRRPPATALRLVSAACTLCLLILLPLRGCDYLQVQMYRDAIPPQFELAEIIFHDELSDFREGCGVAIFRLSDESIARIHRGGLHYLESARLGRDGIPYHRYAPWAATPALNKENLFRGNQCVKNTPDLLQQAHQFLDKEGAFFTTGPEHDVVLIPSLGVVIFSHNG